MSKTVAAPDFVAHSNELLDEVEETQEEVLVTKNGKVVAKLVPAVSLEELRRPALEKLRRDFPVRIVGDIVEPLDDEWDVMK